MFRHAAHVIFVSLLLGMIGAGCGGGSKDRPALGQVHGRVTLDAQPVVHAAIVFEPQHVAGRQSLGVTDANGKYVLHYIRDETGAAIGKNTVRISTQRTNDPATETLPKRYNQETTLVREVKAGDNEIDFELTSTPK